MGRVSKLDDGLLIDSLLPKLDNLPMRKSKSRGSPQPPVRRPLSWARTPALPSYLHYSNHLIRSRWTTPPKIASRFLPHLPTAFTPVLRPSWFKLPSLQQSATGGARFSPQQNYSQPFPLSNRRENNTLSRRDCVIRRETASPSTFLRHPTRHSPTRRRTISVFKMGKLIRLELFSTFSPRLEHLGGSCH